MAFVKYDCHSANAYRLGPRAIIPFPLATLTVWLVIELEGYNSAIF